MNIIFKVVFTVIMVLFISLTGTSVVTAEQDSNIASDYFDDVSSVIRESNYSQTVINECISDATENGYTLSVEVIGSDEIGMMRYAKVTMQYHYTIPLFNVDEVKTKTKII